MAPKVEKMTIAAMCNKQLKQNPKLCKEVLKRYGLPNEYWAKNRLGYTHAMLIEAAIDTNNAEIVKLLIDKGCPVNMKIMHKAIDQENVKIVNKILETDKSLLQGKVYEVPPLNYAAKIKSESIFKFLLKKGADWTAVDSLGDSILHAAAENLVNNEPYNPEAAINIMKIVLSKKMSVDIENTEGETPLHFAAVSQQKEVVEFLLSLNANLNALNKKGNSALHLLIKHNCHSKFNYQGYNYDYDDDSNEVQKDKKRAEFVDWLISKGINAELQNNNGESPLFLAVVHRQKEVIKVLLLHCSKISDSDNNNAVFDIFLKAYLKTNQLASDEIIEMATQFLEKGAAVDRVNKYGEKPIDLVNTAQQTRLREVMLQYSTKMDISTEP